MSILETKTSKILETVSAEQGVSLPDLMALNALDLPGDDGEPMENERERIQISLGIESLDQHWKDRNDFYVGGNMFVYYSLSQAQTVLEELTTPGLSKRAFRGPDMFVVLNVDGSYRRQKWVVWEEDGRYPNIIFEFLSPKTRSVDLGKKKHLYEQTFGTREYFCFDYLNPTGEESLLGWRLDAHGRYQPITADSRGWLWSEYLELWVGRWPGNILRDNTVWMRFYTPDGELVLTPAEVERQRADSEHRRAEQEAQRAEREHQRAERLAAQLRTMGIEPNEARSSST
jgi:Uma2 family endonuclease